MARILAVDDEPLNLEIIGEYLDESGFEITTADNGEAGWAALDKTDETPYDLILLDRMMPGMDGLTLLKQIKAEPRFATIPVIMQTAANSPDQIGEGLAAGAYYYLTKPYRRDALLSIIRAALADAHARSQLQRQLHEHINALQFLETGHFSIRTTLEATRLAAFVAQACPSPDTAVLGLSELLINGVEHGNLGISYQEKSALKQVGNWQAEVDRRSNLPENLGKRVRLDFAKHPDQICITITDQGIGFDWQRYMALDPERAFDPNGRGIALAQMMSFESLTYENGGARAIVTISLPRATIGHSPS